MLALSLDIGKQFGYPFDEHTYPGNTPAAGGVEQVDRRHLIDDPVGERGHELAALNLPSGPLMPVQQSRDAVAGNGEIAHHVAMSIVDDQPAAHRHGDTLLTAPERP